MSTHESSETAIVRMLVAATGLGVTDLAEIAQQQFLNPSETVDCSLKDFAVLAKLTHGEAIADNRQSLIRVYQQALDELQIKIHDKQKTLQHWKNSYQSYLNSNYSGVLLFLNKLATTGCAESDVKNQIQLFMIVIRGNQVTVLQEQTTQGTVLRITKSDCLRLSDPEMRVAILEQFVNHHNMHPHMDKNFSVVASNHKRAGRELENLRLRQLTLTEAIEDLK